MIDLRDRGVLTLDGLNEALPAGDTASEALLTREQHDAVYSQLQALTLSGPGDLPVQAITWRNITLRCEEAE